MEIIPLKYHYCVFVIDLIFWKYSKIQLKNPFAIFRRSFGSDYKNTSSLQHFIIKKTHMREEKVQYRSNHCKIFLSQFTFSYCMMCEWLSVWISIYCSTYCVRYVKASMKLLVFLSLTSTNDQCCFPFTQRNLNREYDGFQPGRIFTQWPKSIQNTKLTLKDVEKQTVCSAVLKI